MAGIGFRLQKLLKGESLSDLIRAYFYSSMIVAGPMLMVILTLALIKSVLQFALTIEDGTYFMGVIVYNYAFSMIGTAPFLYVATRYLADKYYLKQTENFTPAYLSCLEIVWLLQALVALIFLYPLTISLHLKWVLFSLYLLISGIWIAMIFLSAARNYFWIMIAFVAGGVGGVLFSLSMGVKMGFSGFLNGFTLGQAITFFVLTIRIFQEYGYYRTHDFGFVFYFKRYPYLVFIGIFYYIAIWADKFIFWFSADGEYAGPGIYVYSNYDTPMFLAFLTIIPSMAFFLVQMETSFSGKYRAYYQAVQNRQSLDVIRTRKEEIIQTLTEHFQKFVLFQGIISGVTILAIVPISEAFNLNPYQLGVLRIGILGAFLQMGFLMVLNIFFYFDFQKEAFWITLFYFASNIIFTWGTLQLGVPAYGFGFAVSNFLSLMFGFLILNHKLKHLEYYTFMPQPILIPKFKLESELGRRKYEGSKTI